MNRVDWHIDVLNIRSIFFSFSMVKRLRFINIVVESYIIHTLSLCSERFMGAFIYHVFLQYIPHD